MATRNKKTSKKMTSARRLDGVTTRLLSRLRQLTQEATARAWAIGDTVNELKARGVPVKDQAALIGGSRQRLSELRQTALAFPESQRPRNIDIHFCTVAVRSARRLKLSPGDVVEELVSCGIDSSRQATRYLADKERRRAAMQSAGNAWATDGSYGFWNQPHREAFQAVLHQLAADSVKLVIADPPYGTYGKYQDGKHSRVTAAAKDCDNLDDESAKMQMADLFRLAAPLMTDGGCLVVFRPGGLADPPWLMQAAEESDWDCRHALAWRRGPVKLGDGRSPYTAGTERILIFARKNQELVNHDGSCAADILQVKLPRKSYASVDQHLFDKPVELMERLILKHTYPGESVIEPFGGTGPVSQAATLLNRHWIYCESNPNNFDLGSRLIAQQIEGSANAAG